MPQARCIYFSTINRNGQSHDMLTAEIVAQAVANNRRMRISSVLLASQYHFVQILEGHRARLTQQIGKIITDPRHSDVRLVDFSSIEERLFGDQPLLFLTAESFVEGFYRMMRDPDLHMLTHTMDAVFHLIRAMSEVAVHRTGVPDGATVSQDIDKLALQVFF